MSAYLVTVTRTLPIIVARTENAASARAFAEGLLDADQVGDSDWDQVITVEPYDSEGTDR